MKYPVEYGEKAVKDLNEIAAYLEQANLGSDTLEERFLIELAKTLDVVANMPNKGSPMKAYNKRLKGLRRWPITGGFENYLLFYLAHEDRVEIVRVFHSSQNYLKTLKKEKL